MTKEELVAKRAKFFDAIMENMNRPPSRIDDILQQSQYYVKPNMEGSVTAPENGDVAISIKGKFFDKEFNLYYTLWQLGDTLRVGVAIYDDELHGAFASDHHNEVFYIWGSKNDPRVDVAHGCVFYDWEFDVPHLYESYKNQERFILGIKHMHFRVMRILHDECQRLKMASSEASTGGSSSFESFQDHMNND